VGLAGIGVDNKGAPIGYLQVCQDHLDGATVYTDGKDDDQGSWKASPAVTGFARWSLTDPGEGWTTKTTLGQLKPGVKYNLLRPDRRRLVVGRRRHVHEGGPRTPQAWPSPVRQDQRGRDRAASCGQQRERVPHQRVQGLVEEGPSISVP